MCIRDSLAAASREAVEDDPLRGDEVRTDRVGHIDRQRVHIVEGDSDPVVAVSYTHLGVYKRQL